MYFLVKPSLTLWAKIKSIRGGRGRGKKSRLGRDAKIISFKKKKKRYIKYLSKKNLKIIPLQMIPNDQIDYGNNSPLLRDCKASATSF